MARFRRRRRGGRRGFRIGKWVNLGFKIAGATVALSPAIQGAMEHTGDPVNIPRGIAYRYTGFDPGNASVGVNWGQTGAGIGSIVAGIVIAKLGGMLAKRF